MSSDSPDGSVIFFAMVALAGMIAVPSYYIGKAVQRAETFSSCKYTAHASLAMDDSGPDSRWIECLPGEVPHK